MSKRLSINLNKQERMLINDVCVALGVQDRSRVVKELAVAKAAEWLKAVANKRMEEREKLVQQENVGERDHGNTASDSTKTRNSSDTDSTVPSEPKDNMA